MKTPNLTLENVEKIEKLFPNCVKETEDEEGNKIKKVDFDLLRAELWDKASVEWLDERYRLDWPWKKRSILKANTPITKTLRPVKKDSVDRDNTWNLYIEWDNFEVLKVLQESYLGKIKCIYVDPPYNTWKDFVYIDNYTESLSDHKERTETDESWNKLVRNSETKWRFHSDWLSMMYERIKISRDLLTDDGVFFISIDDNEVDNLRKICDEIFWEGNFIAQIIVDWTPKNDPYVVSTSHEYCIVYSKDFESIKLADYWIRNPRFDDLREIFSKWNNNYTEIQNNLRKYYEDNDLLSDNIANYKFADKKWIYRLWPIDDPQNSWPKDLRKNPKTGWFCLTPTRGRSCTESTWNERLKEWLIEFPDTDDKLPAKKTYVTADRLDVMRSYIKVQTRKDTDYLKKLFWLEYTPFSNPKPLSLIKTFIENCNDKNMIVLDYFSGSWTTAHAVIDLNSKDWWNRKFLLVQLQEDLDISKSQSSKEKKITQAAIDFCDKHNMPRNICEIWKERIRRSAQKIKEETNADIDYGFRVYRVDESCMKDVYYHPSEAKQENLALFTSNIKEDGTPEDLLTQVILNFWLTLDLPIEEKTIWNNKVFYVAWNSLIACFDENIDDNVIDEIAKDEPIKLVFRDACFKNDAQRINVENKVKRVSPETIIKVI